MREGGINDPFLFKAVFLAGGPGSGKSYVARDLFGGLGLKNVNIDNAFEFILKRRGLSLSIDPKNPAEFAEQMKVRDRARHLETMQRVSWTNGMLGLVMDGTGADYTRIKGLKEGLEAMGYDTSMVFVDTTLEVAQQRNKERTRSVPEDIVVTSWKAVQDNVPKYKTLFGSQHFFTVDNSRAGEDEQELGRMRAAVRKKTQAWLTRPLQNPVGKAILQSIRAIGGKNISDLNVAIQKAASKK